MNELMSAAAAFGEAGSQVSGVDTVDVPASSWLVALQAVAAAGGSYLDALAAADLASEGLQIVAHVLPPSAVAGVLVRTTVSGADPTLDSLGSVWAGATWHEREITDLFGITFVGSSDDRPLLLDRDGPPPLLKSTRLEQRYDDEWPGGFDPADRPGARPRLPLGVDEAP